MRKHIESFFPGKSDSIIKLFQLTNVEIEGKVESKEDLLEALNKAAQTHFLRKPGSERWQIKDNESLTHHRKEIWEILNQLGIINAVQPAFKEYDHVLLLGALQPRVELRRQSLEQMVDKFDLTIHNSYLLGGKRPLRPEDESLSKVEGVNTELEMMQRDWADHLSDMPQALKAAAHYSVDAPMKWHEKLQKEVRPNTQDTIVHLMEMKHIAKQIKEQGHLGKVLVVSNQPFCLYQDAIVRGILPEGTLIETVGSAAESTIELGVALDSVARWIYATRETYKKKLSIAEMHAEKVVKAILPQFDMDTKQDKPILESQNSVKSGEMRDLEALWPNYDGNQKSNASAHK